MTMKVVSASEDDFRFADDIVVNADEEEEAGVPVDHLDTTITRYKMESGPDKTKVMTNNPNGFQREIKTKGQRLEEVENFKYLGAIISNEGSKPKILSRIAQTTAALSRLKIIWRDKNISLVSKVKLMRTLILSTFLYACESWTLTAEIERRIQALEMRCYKRLLNISYKDHATNEEVRNRILRNWSAWCSPNHGKITETDMVRPHHKILGMAKTILQETVKGARRRGRQKKIWEDNIKEWTGMRLGDSLRAAEDREGWKDIVATSSVVPWRPPRLRDEMRWDECYNENSRNLYFFAMNCALLILCSNPFNVQNVFFINANHHFFTYFYNRIFVLSNQDCLQVACGLPYIIKCYIVFARQPGLHFVFCLSLLTCFLWPQKMLQHY